MIYTYDIALKYHVNQPFRFCNVANKNIKFLKLENIQSCCIRIQIHNSLLSLITHS